MTKSKKLFMALLAIAPAPFLFINLTRLVNFLTGLKDIEPGHIFHPDLKSIYTFIFLFVFMSLLSLVMYILDILNSEKMKKDANSRFVWLAAVFLAGFVGRIVYFFMEIYPRPQA